MTPSSWSPDMTGRAPMFLSAMSWMASKTVASGEMVQVGEFLWARISLITPGIILVPFGERFETCDVATGCKRGRPRSGDSQARVGVASAQTSHRGHGLVLESGE